MFYFILGIILVPLILLCSMLYLYIKGAKSFYGGLGRKIV